MSQKKIKKNKIKRIRPGKTITVRDVMQAQLQTTRMSRKTKMEMWVLDMIEAEELALEKTTDRNYLRETADKMNSMHWNDQGIIIDWNANKLQKTLEKVKLFKPAIRGAQKDRAMLDDDQRLEDSKLVESSDGVREDDSK